MKRMAWLLFANLMLFFSSGPGSQAKAPLQAAGPANFLGSAQSTTSIQWSWDPTTGASFYELHADPDPGTGSPTVIATFIMATSFVESGLSENTRYPRHVHASVGGFLSPASNADAKYTLVHTPTDADFSLSAPSSTTVQITVTPPPNANADSTGVEVQRIGFGVLQPFSQMYTQEDSGLQPNTEYCYQIKFRNGDAIETAFSDPTSSSCITTPPTTVEACPKPKFTVSSDFTVELEKKPGKTHKERIKRTFVVNEDKANVKYTSHIPGNATTFGDFELELKDPGEDDMRCLCWFCYFPKDNTKHELDMKFSDIHKTGDPTKRLVLCGTNFLWIACKFKHNDPEKDANCCKDFVWVQLIKQNSTGIPGDGDTIQKKPVVIKNQFSFNEFRVDAGPCTSFSSPDGYPKSCDQANPASETEKATFTIDTKLEANGQQCKLFHDFPSLEADAGAGADNVTETLEQSFQTFLVCISGNLPGVVAQENWGHKVSLSVVAGTPTCSVTDRTKTPQKPPKLDDYKAALNTYFDGLKEKMKTTLLKFWGAQ